MAPGELAEHPEPAPAALEDLTEQPGPRNTRSWPPPRAGGRMGGCETTPPDSRTDPREPAPGEPRLRQATTGRLSSLAIIGHRLPGSSSFVLARALTGANGCGRSSLTPDRAAARNQQLRGKPTTTANPGPLPGRWVSTARSVDSEGPHGWLICAC